MVSDRDRKIDFLCPVPDRGVCRLRQTQLDSQPTAYSRLVSGALAYGLNG